MLYTMKREIEGEMKHKMNQSGAHDLTRVCYGAVQHDSTMLSAGKDECEFNFILCKTSSTNILFGEKFV